MFLNMIKNISQLSPVIFKLIRNTYCQAEGRALFLKEKKREREREDIGNPGDSFAKIWINGESLLKLH